MAPFPLLLIAPIIKYALLGGKLLAQFLLTLVQLLVLFLIGYFAFHSDDRKLARVLLAVYLPGSATTGLAICPAGGQDAPPVSPIVTLVALITSAIGGSWWPLADPAILDAAICLLKALVSPPGNGRAE